MTEIDPKPVYPVPSLRVIARDEHGLSRKQMSQNALRVLYRLREAGFGGYLQAAQGRKGGAIRTRRSPAWLATSTLSSLET